MNLYIGNLNYNVKESDLRNVMEEYGAVASVKLITDRETRRSKALLLLKCRMIQKQLTLSKN